MVATSHQKNSSSIVDESARRSWTICDGTRIMWRNRVQMVSSTIPRMCRKFVSGDDKQNDTINSPISMKETGALPAYFHSNRKKELKRRLIEWYLPNHWNLLKEHSTWILVNHKQSQRSLVNNLQLSLFHYERGYYFSTSNGFKFLELQMNQKIFCVFCSWAFQCSKKYHMKLK